MKFSFKIAALTAALATAGLAQAATPTQPTPPSGQELAFNDGPPPPPFADRDGPRHGGDFRGTRGGMGHGGPMMGMGPGMGGPLMHELRGLKLSDAQSDKIDDIFMKHHKEQRALFKRERDLREAMHKLDPTAKDFLSTSNKLADTAGKLTEDKMQLHAKVASEVIATLTPEQVQELQKRRAEREQHRGKGKHGKGMDRGMDRDDGPSDAS
ncbi:Spy/CpxP family protein refolding chaperone [Solimonas marina]|uniref:Spy/CpxP family protein refolding chaperone n=1 Tax=Solimonas marina TaxID=2714601 RepID=A0A969W9T4_9GAMM|nr:Spy/CpxP family protein refolding chaperone [Solimonas marina]NKF22150.1 Spy/CpxP family protein refolding chaperone [Solimonas marina]